MFLFNKKDLKENTLFAVFEQDVQTLESEVGTTAARFVKTKKKFYYQKLSALDNYNYPSALLEFIFLKIYGAMGLAPESKLSFVSYEEAFSMLDKRLASAVPQSEAFKILLNDEIAHAVRQFSNNQDAVIVARELNNIVDKIIVDNEFLNHLTTLVNHLSNYNNPKINQFVSSVRAAFTRLIRQEEDFLNEFNKNIGNEHRNERPFLSTILKQLKAQTYHPGLEAAQYKTDKNANVNYLTVVTEFLTGVHPSDFIKSIQQNNTLPEHLNVGKDTSYSIVDLGKIAAFAKLLGDIDWIGEKGTNIILLPDHENNKLYVKIIDVNMSLYDKTHTEDLKFSSMLESKISFKALPLKIKDEFIWTLLFFNEDANMKNFKKLIQNITREFYEGNDFIGVPSNKVNAAQKSNEITDRIMTYLKNNLDAYLKIYQEDIQDYQNRHHIIPKNI